MQSTQNKTVELRPLKDSDKDYEAIEKQIIQIFKKEIYAPLVKALGMGTKTLQNSVDDLRKAIQFGRIQFYRGQFTGKFNSTISKQLKEIGAKWDAKTGAFKLNSSELPIEIRNAVSASESHFQAKIAEVDRKLAQIVPEEIADRLKVSEHFDSTLWKVNKDFRGSLRGLTIAPELTPEQRKRLANEWQNNLKLPIVNWTQKEVVNLRKAMQQSVFAGNRNEVAVKIIKDSYDVSINKAKFLARQETRLLLTKFKQTRYEEAGVEEYKWGISNNSIQAKGAPFIKGQVRHDHGALEGKTFKWNNPPVTNTITGARNNPGQDFNCRCFAIPIVRFKK